LIMSCPKMDGASESATTYKPTKQGYMSEKAFIIILPDIASHVK
jgi:hypothetical protein